MEFIIGSKFFDKKDNTFYVQVYEAYSGKTLGEYTEKKCDEFFPECIKFTDLHHFYNCLYERYHWNLWICGKISYNEYKKYKC